MTKENEAKIREAKKALRKSLLQRRKALSEAAVKEKSEAIFRNWQDKCLTARMNMKRWLRQSKIQAAAFIWAVGSICQPPTRGPSN